MRTATAQQDLPLPLRGGKRRGAGRKPAAQRAGRSHAARESFGRAQPVHVTLRVADHVWNLRSQRSFRVFHRAVNGVRRVTGFRVVHFDVLGNHLHFIVEADGPRRLASGMRALTIRLALGLNAMMGRKGEVFPDRYHAHVLRTPAEVRNALRYVLGNFESHAERRGEPRSTKGWVDPFSSAARKAPRESQLALFVDPATSGAQSWLLRKAEQDVLAGRRPGASAPPRPLRRVVE